ncbi:MAG: DUF5362 family protein [Chitinophagaceae bacterium]
MDQRDLITPELTFDSSIQLHLKETGMWARFLGITGLIMSVLITIGGILFSSNLGSSGSVYGYNETAKMAIGIGYIVVGVILFFMSLFLYRFGKNMKLALETIDQVKLDASLLSLKQYHRMAGIITIIYLVIIVLALLVGLINGLGRSY